MAGVTGLEPAAFCVTGRRSNQLSYTPLICGMAGNIHQFTVLCKYIFRFKSQYHISKTKIFLAVPKNKFSKHRRLAIS